MGEALKEKKRGYDSDEDEANPLIIEEDESMQHDNQHSENDEDGDNKFNSKSSVSVCINSNK